MSNSSCVASNESSIACATRFPWTGRSTVMPIRLRPNPKVRKRDSCPALDALFPFRHNFRVGLCSIYARIIMRA